MSGNPLFGQFPTNAHRQITQTAIGYNLTTVNLRCVRCCLVVSLLWPLHGCQQALKATDEGIVRIDSETEVHGIIGSKRPFLGITCSAHRPAVFLANAGHIVIVFADWGQQSFQGGGSSILHLKKLKIKVDDLTPVDHEWVEAKDRLYSPTPATLIRQLASAKTIRLEWLEWQRQRPSNYTPMVFDLSRWAATLAKLENICAH